MHYRRSYGIIGRIYIDCPTGQCLSWKVAQKSWNRNENRNAFGEFCRLITLVSRPRVKHGTENEIIRDERSTGTKKDQEDDMFRAGRSSHGVISE